MKEGRAYLQLHKNPFLVVYDYMHLIVTTVLTYLFVIRNQEEVFLVFL